MGLSGELTVSEFKMSNINATETQLNFYQRFRSELPKVIVISLSGIFVVGFVFYTVKRLDELKTAVERLQSRYHDPLHQWVMESGLSFNSNTTDFWRAFMITNSLCRGTSMLLQDERVLNQFKSQLAERMFDILYPH